MSERGHLSNEQSAELLVQLLDNQVECIIGMHVSENNNTYRLPHDVFQETLDRHDHPARALVGYQNRLVSVG